MKSIIEQDGEQIIDSWTLNCIPFGGSRSLGKLYVTKSKLYFEAQFDSSLKGLIQSVATSVVVASGHTLLVTSEILDQWRDKGYLSIEKKHIKNIDDKSSFFKKTVTVTLEDDSEVVFDYGMLSVKKLVEAIKA